MLLLRDRRADLEAARTSPFGISRDSPWSHVAWRAALDLDLPLLSDWNGEAVEGFGVAREWRGLRGVADRSAFLLDGDRVVRWARRYDTDDVPDVDEIVAAAARVVT
jgi:peroxiredoxin